MTSKDEHEATIAAMVQSLVENEKQWPRILDYVRGRLEEQGNEDPPAELVEGTALEAARLMAERAHALLGEVAVSEDVPEESEHLSAEDRAAALSRSYAEEIERMFGRRGNRPPRGEERQ